jgi:hypothetical protein
MKGEPEHVCVFSKKVLDVKPAHDPQLLLWENFGASPKYKYLRILIFILLIIIILNVCFLTVLHGEAFIYDYEKKLPSYNC